MVMNFMVLIEVLLHSLVVGTIFIGSSSYSSSY